MSLRGAALFAVFENLPALAPGASRGYSPPRPRLRTRLIPQAPRRRDGILDKRRLVVLVGAVVAWRGPNQVALQVPALPHRLWVGPEIIPEHDVVSIAWVTDFQYVEVMRAGKPLSKVVSSRNPVLPHVLVAEGNNGIDGVRRPGVGLDADRDIDNGFRGQAGHRGAADVLDVESMGSKSRLQAVPLKCKEFGPPRIVLNYLQRVRRRRAQRFVLTLGHNILPVPPKMMILLIYRLLERLLPIELVPRDPDGQPIGDCFIAPCLIAPPVLEHSARKGDENV